MDPPSGYSSAEPWSLENRVSCVRSKQASKPRLGLPAVQHSSTLPKHQRKIGHARLTVLGKHAGPRPPQQHVGLTATTPPPELMAQAGVPTRKPGPTSKPAPQPSKSTAAHRQASKAHASKLPTIGAVGTSTVKAGKAAHLAQQAKRGGCAKTAKLTGAKLHPLPSPTPARRPRRAAASPQPVQLSLQAASPAPPCSATPSSTTASGAEDDDPGIGSAGSPAGGDSEDPALVAAPQAPATASQHGEESLRASPEAHSSPSNTARSPRRLQRGAGQSRTRLRLMAAHRPTPRTLLPGKRS